MRPSILYGVSQVPIYGKICTQFAFNMCLGYALYYLLKCDMELGTIYVLAEIDI